MDVIMISSITHALKGRDALRRRGFSVRMERIPGGRDSYGCGYSIYICSRDTAEAVLILESAGVRINGVEPADGYVM